MASSSGSTPGLFEWGRHRLPARGPFSLTLSTLTVFVEYRDQELWVATANRAEGSPPPSMDSPELEWSRWAASNAPEELEIVPTLPDRSLVLRPENPFHLLPGARARVFVRLPIWLQVRLPGSKNAVVAEAPTRVLSDTWWGSPAEGNLCYWLDITARRQADDTVFRADRILCPLDLKNEAEEDLSVEKLLLRCEHLSVFRGPGSLWTDEVEVRYQGEEEGSEIQVTGRTPPEAPGAPRLTPPRTPLAKRFSARTFARLKSLPGLGG